MKFKKISTKLILYFSLFILLPTCIVGGYSYNTSQNALKHEAEETLKAILDGTQGKIQMEMSQVEQIGELISDLSAMEEVADELKRGDIRYATSATAEKSIRSFKKSIEEFTEDIVVIDTKGKVILDGSNGVNRGLDLTERDYFKGAMKGNKVWGQVSISKISGKPISAYSIPLKDQQDQIVGAVAVVFKIEAMQNILKSIQIGDTGYAYMVDEQGRLLYHIDETKILTENILNMGNEDLTVHGQQMIAGKEDTGFYTYEGIYKLVMYKPVGKWAVAVNIPVEEYMKGAIQIRNNTFLIALVTLFIGIAAAFAISLQITNPIKKLVGSIKVVEKGDLTNQVENKHLQKCWEVMKCDKKECPAYKNEENLRCWQIAGTYCHGEIQGEMASKLATCEQCPTYKKANGDEIRQMTMSFNNMVAGFQNMIRDVIQVAGQTSASSEELASASEQSGQSANEVAMTIESITSNTETQRGYIHQTKELVNTLMKKLNEVNQSSQDMKAFSGQVSISAADGKEFLEKSIHQMEVINASAEDTSQILQILEESINEISNITEVISNISEQTNLLALNANIEAARAGEHGRGFAVVADEVRNLAEETKKSAASIAQLVGHIQQDADKVIVSMKKSNEEIEHGKENILKTGSSFENIIQLIQQVGEKIQSVSRAIEQMQADGKDVTNSVEEIAIIIDQAAVGIQQVSASAEEQSATAEEIASSSEDLSKMAEDLYHYVETFKV